MRLFLAFTASLAAMAAAAAFAQQLNPAPGRGLLPQPYGTPPKLERATVAHPFERDPSGTLSRTVFETHEDPNFEILIREFSFPPDRQAHAITFASGAFLHFFGEPAAVTIAGQPLTLHAGERAAVAANTRVEVVNKGERSIVVRALIVEAK